MALAVADRLLETSTTTGTGTYALAGAVTGYRAFSAACANNDTVEAFVEEVDANGVPSGGWEVGTYTWGTGGTLARTAIVASSNANAAVSWTAGTRRIGVGLTAGRLTALMAGGVTGFTPSLSTASPNSTVNASQLLASGGSTNQDAVLQPKGTGALLAQLPDSTTAGGNKRGANAVDLQTTRAAADQVASGSLATIAGGRNNKCEGGQGFIGGGLTNTIGSGRTNAVIAGGTLNTISGSLNTISGGNSNSAGGAKSTIGGGESNQTTVGDYATVAGGDRNQANNYNASVGGGSQNIANGDSSTVVGGTLNNAEGVASTAMGTNAQARTRGSVAQASGLFAIQGDAQIETLVHRAQTTNATTTSLSANGSAPSAATGALLPNNSLFGFEVTVSAKVATFGDRAVFRITGAISRGANAAATQIDGTPTVTTIAAVGGASAWTVAAMANTTLGSLEIAVVGAASTSIKWVSSITLTEVVG